MKLKIFPQPSRINPNHTKKSPSMVYGRFQTIIIMVLTTVSQPLLVKVPTIMSNAFEDFSEIFRTNFESQQ